MKHLLTSAAHRTLSTAMFVVSFLGYFWLLDLTLFMYSPWFITNKFPPQIWRLLTCFIITGPKLGILFDTYFLCSSLWYLESSHTRLSTRRADLAWFLLLMCALIMAIAHAIDWVYPTMTEALIMAICYTATQEQRGSRTQYILFSIPTQTMPLAMLLFSFFIEEGMANFKKQLIGIVAAHFYLFVTKIWPDFGNGRDFIKTPSIMFTLVGRKAGEPLQGGHTLREQDAALPNVGPLPDSWASRGRGQRLG